jgi:hypothetical protein
MSQQRQRQHNKDRRNSKVEKGNTRYETSIGPKLVKYKSASLKIVGNFSTENLSLKQYLKVLFDW